jgi:hypothetical protein
MARSIKQLYDEGLVSDRVLARVAKNKRAPEEFCRDEINYRTTQRDGTRSTGLPGTMQYGPADAGHIDAKANRRRDKEARAGKQKLPGNQQPTTAEIRRASAVEYWPDAWYGSGPRHGNNGPRY